MTESRARFFGTYVGVLTTNGGTSSTPQTITITSSSSNVQTMIINNLVQSGSSIAATTNVYGGFTGLNIATQVIAGTSTQLQGYGDLASDGVSLNISLNVSTTGSANFVGTKQ